MLGLHRVLAIMSLPGIALLVSLPNDPSERPTPAPPFRALNDAPRSEAIRYARALEFDTSYHGTDTRRLTVRVRGTLNEGPMATLSAEVGTRLLSEEDLVAGRVVARLTTDAAFPIQGLGAGENYLWLQQRDGRLEAVIIPADSSLPLRIASVKRTHMKMSSGLTGARLKWKDESGSLSMWVPCGMGCCYAE
jgi:hypothetical protein